MHKLRAVLLLVIMMLSVMTHAASKVDSLLNRLDEAIANKDQYREVHEKQINLLRMELRRTDKPSQRFELSKQLANLYRCYQSDSSLLYLRRAVDEAVRTGDINLITRARSELVSQDIRVQKVADAVRNFNEIKRTPSLDSLTLKEYYYAASSYYECLRHHISDQSEVARYDVLYQSYQDSLIMILPPHDNMRYLLYFDRAMYGDNLKEAQNMLDEWAKYVPSGSRDEPVLYFYRYLIYDRMGDIENAEINIIRSTLCDVESASYDETAIYNLCHILRDRGDTHRAQNYMRYAFESWRLFGAQMRNWMATDVQDVNMQYEELLKNGNRKILFGIVALSILTVLSVLLLLRVYRQRNDLMLQRQRVNAINDELQKSNENLKALNRQKDETNALLNESNIIKEEYIGMFFGLCVSYIEQQENYRKNINKLVRNHQFDEVTRMIKAYEGNNETYSNLYNKFDQVFLNLFPQFVEQFNDLVQESYRIETKPDQLNTPLRIYALIRLGISDSVKISHFLNLAISTVYNYRVKYKNVAVVDRNEFENIIKQLGNIKDVGNSE